MHTVVDVRWLVLVVLLVGCTAAPPDPSWAMRAVHAPDEPPPRPQVRVAVLDGLPDRLHPALQHLGGDGTPHPDGGMRMMDFMDDASMAPSAHATAVVGILAGLDGDWQGVVPTVQVTSARVCDQQSCSVHAIKRALDELGRDADVISISFSNPPDGSMDGVFEDRVEDAIARGAIVVVSVGNRGPEGPANSITRIPGVVSVAAADPRGVAEFSSRGRSTHCPVPSQCLIPVVPTVAAPGVVWAPTLDGYGWMEGTSFAVPFVAAAAALAFPQLPPEGRSPAFQDLLAATSSPMAGQVEPHDARAGYGMLNLEMLLRP